ncbi:MAG: hypothetical protein PWP23_508 [Candidatus Sumerlaeota bacterium]|nr:hypothetical protein [Candidatus Sumerlaeota bacterium]
MPPIPPLFFHAGPADVRTARPLVDAALAGDASPEDALRALAASVIGPWTIYPFLLLRRAGIDCTLTDQLPERGILIASACSIPISWKPPRGLTFVCTVADSPRRPYAQVLLCQNPAQIGEIPPSPFGALPIERFLPHPPQPGLLPRDARRGERFENVVYMGKPAELAPELASDGWRQALEQRGLRWIVRGPETWHDYADADAVLAVRRFHAPHLHTHKPATKLHNAWLAGVPAVLGRESSCRAERRTPHDYLEVDSVEEALAALDRLRADVQLRQAMASNGLMRARTITTAAHAERWVEIATQLAPAAHETWSALGPAARMAYFAERHARRKWFGLRKRIREENP